METCYISGWVSHDSMRGGVSHSTLPFVQIPLIDPRKISSCLSRERLFSKFEAIIRASHASINLRTGAGPHWKKALIPHRLHHRRLLYQSDSAQGKTTVIKELINPAHGEVCYFGKLPPELRVMIYNLVLNKQRPLPICSSRRLPQNSPSVCQLCLEYVVPSDMSFPTILFQNSICCRH